MNTKNKVVDGKMVITSRGEFDLMSSMMTKEKFFNKFTLSIKLATLLTAEEGIKRTAFLS